jgi:cytoskeletal protein CcmA (bactofilin family)
MILDFEQITGDKTHVSKTYIDRSVTINGDLNFIGTLDIQGSIVGNITSNPNSISFLIIGEHSQINGNVASSHVIVCGNLIGNICAQHVEIEETAHITGNVKYKSIEVHSGAKIDGLMTTIKKTKNIILNSSITENIQSFHQSAVSDQLNPNVSLTKQPNKQIEVPA